MALWEEQSAEQGRPQPKAQLCSSLVGDGSSFGLIRAGVMDISYFLKKPWFIMGLKIEAL